MAIANINVKTGINYGAVSGNSLHPDVIDSLLNGVNLSEADFIMNKARELANKDIESFDDEINPSHELYVANDTANKMIEKMDAYVASKPQTLTQERIDEHSELMGEMIEFIGEHDIDVELELAYMDNESDVAGIYEDVHYTLTYLGGAITIIVEESPLKGTFDQCSPCLPNCGDIDSPSEDGIECYTVPADWFDAE